MRKSKGSLPILQEKSGAFSCGLLKELRLGMFGTFGGDRLEGGVPVTKVSRSQGSLIQPSVAICLTSGIGSHSFDSEIGIERDRLACSMFDNEREGRLRDTTHLLVVDR